MFNNLKVTAIVLAAGNSTRYGKGINKNLELINGKQVLLFSLDVFEACKYVDEIVVAVKEDEINLIQSLINIQNYTNNIKLIVGGSSRKESVYNCLKNIDSEIVIIHDSARPVIRQEYIKNCMQELRNFKAVTIGVKSKDTIKITDDSNIVLNSTSRNNTWLIQTPQCFYKDALLSLHKKYSYEDFTDDCMLFEKDGYEVKVIEGNYMNIKITTSEDIIMAELFLNHISTYN